MDDPEMGAHQHHMPRWGRILWRRWWEMSAQVDRLAARIHHVEETMATQADIDAVTTELTDAAQRIQDEIAQLQQANPALDLSALQAEADALANIAPAPAPVDNGGDVPPAA